MRPLLTDLRGNPIYSYAQRRFRRMRHSHLSTLMFYVENRSWDDVVRRARKFPSEVLLQDEVTRNTALHAACRLDPPPAVIRALEKTSRVKNAEGATPLHIAASHRCSAESIVVLIECAERHAPDESGQTSCPYRKASADGKWVSPTADLSRMGRSPIHYACMSFRGLQLEAFRQLFEATLTKGYVVLKSEKDFDLDDFVEEGLLGDDEDMYCSFDDQRKVEVNVLGLKDGTGQTPLALLFRRYRERVKLVIRTVDRLHRQHKESPNKAALAAAMTVHADLGELWEKARWIVARLTRERIEREGCDDEGEQLRRKGVQSPGEQAVSQEAARWAIERLKTENSNSFIDSGYLPMSLAKNSTDEEASIKANSAPERARRRFRIVHSSVGLAGYGCPPEMIRLAISLHPHQVKEMDEDGNLPIHIAVTASSFLSSVEDTSPVSMAAAAAAAVDASDDASVLSEAFSFFSSATISQTTNPFDKVIKILLQHYPEGARVPHGRSGVLPLALAIESGRRTWGDGIRTLMNAYPPALHSKKLIDRAMYPNVLALVTRRNHDPDNHSDGRPLSLRDKRHREEVQARTTLFELLRTKPELLERSLSA